MVSGFFLTIEFHIKQGEIHKYLLVSNAVIFILHKSVFKL